jgi:hypothetical protein
MGNWNKALFALALLLALAMVTIIQLLGGRMPVTGNVIVPGGGDDGQNGSRDGFEMSGLGGQPPGNGTDGNGSGGNAAEPPCDPSIVARYGGCGIYAGSPAGMAAMLTVFTPGNESGNASEEQNGTRDQIPCYDNDGDGHYGFDAGLCASGTDCDDGNAAVNPGVAEACDGLDNDCDEAVDEDIQPEPTLCGVGQCAAQGGLVCSDGQLIDSCVPGEPAEDVCGDGLDNDCDGLTDCYDSDCFDYGTCGTTPAPEFAFVAIPVGILGLMLLFSYNAAKKKNN